MKKETLLLFLIYFRFVMGYRRKKIESNRNEDEVEDRSSGMKRKQIKSYLTLGQRKYLRVTRAHKTPRKLKHLHLSPPRFMFTGAH